MEVKTDYKQTEVGVIPEDWETCYLQDLVDSSNPITYGVLKPGDYVPNGIPLLQIKDVIHGDIDPTQLHRIGTQLDGQYSRTRLVGEEIVVSLVGTIGRIAHIPKLLAGGNLHRNLARIFVSENHSSRFVFYYLSSERIQRAIKLTTFGSTQSLLNLSDLRKLPIAIPPLAEQRAIAGALSDVDALIGALDQLIAKKRDLKHAAMQQLLTGQKRLPGFYGDWEVKTLGDICGRITTGMLDANAMVANGDYPFFTCASENYWIDKYAFDCEALLLSGNGANVGYVHYYNGKFNAYQRTYVISEFSADVQFIKLFLDRNLQQRIRTEVNAGNTPYIRMGTLTEMRVVLPPCRGEQTAIAEVLSEMDAELTALEQRRDKTRSLKQGMMQELLTGRTRLVDKPRSYD